MPKSTSITSNRTLQKHENSWKIGQLANQCPRFCCKIARFFEYSQLIPMRNKSIYERSFRPFESAPKIYEENLSYRLQRGLTERSHQPLDWPDDSSDSDTMSLPDSTAHEIPTNLRDSNAKVTPPEMSQPVSSILNSVNVIGVTMCDGISRITADIFFRKHPNW